MKKHTMCSTPSHSGLGSSKEALADDEEAHNVQHPIRGQVTHLNILGIEQPADKVVQQKR